MSLRGIYSSTTLDPAESKIFQERTKKWLEIVLEKAIYNVYKKELPSKEKEFSEDDSELESERETEVLNDAVQETPAPKITVMEFDAKILSDGLQRAISRHLPIIKFTVKSKVNEDSAESMDHLFVKLLDDEVDPEDHLDEKRELYFYTKAIPDLLEWVATRDKKISLGIPRCYYGQFIEEKGSSTKVNDSEETLMLDTKSVLVLEDLTAEGYAASPSRNGLQREEVRAALKELAIIHSISWAYQQVMKEDIGETHNLVENIEDFAQGYVDDIEESFPRLGEYILEKLSNGPEIISRLEAFKPKIYGTLLELLNSTKSKEGFLSLIHMDCSNQNLLFQSGYEGSGIKCKIIDWKNAIIGSPTHDIACLLLTSVNSLYRSMTTTTLLEYYWKIFVGTAAGLKVIVPYSFEWFKQEYKRSKILPIIIMMGSLSLAFDQTIEKLVEILQEAVESNLI